VQSQFFKKERLTLALWNARRWTTQILLPYLQDRNGQYPSTNFKHT